MCGFALPRSEHIAFFSFFLKANTFVFVTVTQQSALKQRGKVVECDYSKHTHSPNHSGSSGGRQATAVAVDGNVS